MPRDILTVLRDRSVKTSGASRWRTSKSLREMAARTWYGDVVALIVASVIGSERWR